MRKIYILLTQPVQSRKSFTQQNGVLNCTKSNLFHQALRVMSLIANFLTTGTINRPGTIPSLSKMIAQPILGYSFLIENSKLPNFPSGSSNGGLTLGTFLKPLFQKSNLVLTSLNNIINQLQMKRNLIHFLFFAQNFSFLGYAYGTSTTACKGMDKQSSSDDTKSSGGIHFSTKRKSPCKRSTTG